jgi:hypothetical protein
MLEQPRLTASPSHPRTSLEQRSDATDSGEASLLNGSKSSPAFSMYSTDSGEAPLNARPEASEAPPLPAPSSDNAVSYFPSRFAAPGGEVASQPPTF